MSVLRLSTGVYALGCLVFCVSYARAAGPGAESPLPQERIVVTPTHLPEEESESLAAVSVISRKEIETSQARDVIDLFRLLPGIDVSRAGGAGQQSSVFLRGTNSNQTLVLIDGVPATSSGTGSFTWENLPLSQIERIEIVRGPRSSYYGANAIGGVIQIFTRRVSGANLKVEAGSFNTRAAEAGFGGGDPDLFVTLNAAASSTDGFSAQNAGGFLFDPDDDGYDNTSLSLGVEARSSPRSELQARLFWSEGDVEFDQGDSETRNVTLGANWTLRTDGGARHRFSVGLENDAIDTPVFASLFETDRGMFGYLYDRPVFGRGAVTAGINYVNEEGRQSDTFSGVDVYDRDREFIGIFGALSWRRGRHQLQISARYDDYSDFGAEPSADLAWGLDLHDRARLTLSAGTAFRAPNFNELFSPGFGGLFAGNPDLDAETSASLEGDFRFRIGARQHFDARLFFTRVDGLIAFQGVDFQAVNINEAEISGLELSYAWEPGGWVIAAGATLQNAKDAATGMRLLRRPDEKASLTGDWRFGDRGSIGGELFYSGERQDIGTALDAYVLVNLRGRIALARHWTLEARVENLLDEGYELSAGFNTADRSGFLGLRWEPGAPSSP